MPREIESRRSSVYRLSNDERTAVRAGMDDARRGDLSPKGKWTSFIACTVIPGRAKREPEIHNHDNEYGFRACAKRRIPE